MAIDIVVISDDVAGKKMAGPGIRAWEISHELGKHFRVCLMVPDYSPQGLSGDFDTMTYSESQPEELIDRASKGDVLIVQGYVLSKFKGLALLKKTIIVDLYVPFVLENMFNFMFTLKDKGLNQVFRRDLDVYQQQLKRGDLFLVANRDQLNLIAGGLLLMGRINPESVSQSDHQINSILEIPFGFRETRRPGDKPALKEKIGFKNTDFVLLWGGVITNWFDPITLIEAMSLLTDSHPQIKLLFLSTTHANPFLPGFDMAGMAMEKAKALGLYEQTVFFNPEWVPYDERGTYFGAADAGVSTHRVHIETRYSFRTRFLDYLNFNLPIVSTEGDYLSRALSEKGALITVKENDVRGLKDAILKLAEDRNVYDRMVRAVKREKGGYSWEQVLNPLVRRLKTMEAQPTGEVHIASRTDHRIRGRVRGFLKKRCPFLKRFQHKPFFARLRRYLDR